jgi:hypothetical protein
MSFEYFKTPYNWLNTKQNEKLIALTRLEDEKPVEPQFPYGRVMFL